MHKIRSILSCALLLLLFAQQSLEAGQGSSRLGAYKKQDNSTSHVSEEELQDVHHGPLVDLREQATRAVTVFTFKPKEEEPAPRWRLCKWMKFRSKRNIKYDETEELP